MLVSLAVNGSKEKKLSSITKFQMAFTGYTVSVDGSSGFKAEAGRYHLYVSLACPWAHRVLIVRRLKGLEDVISHTVVDWLLTEKGWNFTDQVTHQLFFDEHEFNSFILTTTQKLLTHKVPVCSNLPHAGFLSGHTLTVLSNLRMVFGFPQALHGFLPP